MEALWLLDFPWPQLAEPVLLPPREGLTLWRTLGGMHGRAYLAERDAPSPDWEALECLRVIKGASFGQAPTCHYVVETDVAPEHEADLNDWYEQEHLPGLARVPGTIRAVRYRRASGSPRYLACYDLVSRDPLERPEWLAVRNTDWSSRIRPLFRNPRRTMFVRPEDLDRAGS